MRARVRVFFFSIAARRGLGGESWSVPGGQGHV